MQRTHFGRELNRPMCGNREEGDLHTTDITLVECWECGDMMEKAALWVMANENRVPKYVRTPRGQLVTAY